MCLYRRFAIYLAVATGISVCILYVPPANIAYMLTVQGRADPDYWTNLLSFPFSNKLLKVRDG